MWQQSTELKVAWRRLRRTVTPNQRTTMSVDGSLYDSRDPHQVMDFIRELVGAWKRPDATISRARKLKDNVWSDVARTSPGDTRFIGPVWVGSGRSLDATDSIVGPAVLWDDPTARPKVEEVQWNKIEPSEVLKRPVRIRAISGFQRGAKRAFDIAFAVTALASTMWLYPFIALAVFIESGRPVHFKHRRESKGGREFSCLKFRTMRRDADQIKARLVAENVADGPQFYIENDPRVTRIGRFLRSYNLDELPQFLNVLMGDMSIVGPRPSPYKENQYCPPWREARLSVRPGITGLWQVMRSRERGKDFQEWIRYDIEYVENMNWKLDLKIIWLTIAMMLKIRSRPNPEAQANGDPATAKLSAD
jgi:lipopolysaccharide/colanic/teichoic acid biosynthesis glycosyltransferase